MREVMVHLGARSYTVQIGPGLLDAVGPECAKFRLGRRAAVVTQPSVAPHAARVTASLRRTGFDPVVVEVAEYQKGSFIAMDELAAFFAKGDPIAKKTPKQFAYKQTIMGPANAAKGYPYPTAKMLAPFKRRWARLYQLPAK